MTKTCTHCGIQFEAKSARARYCGSTCRARASEQAKPVKPVQAAQEPPADVTALRAAILSELRAADRLDTFLGQQALRLAERMDGQSDTGSAFAALSKELRAVMDAALAGAPKAADALDELSERRKLKASGA